MKKTLSLLLCMLMALCFIAGCSTAPSTTPANTDSGVSSDAATTPASTEETDSGAQTAFAPITASFLHGAGGSTWPMLAEGVGECIRRLAPGSSITTVPGGAVSNAQLVASGEYELGFTFYDTLLDAKNGRGAFEGAVSDNLKVIACVFSTYSQPFCYAEEPFNSLTEFFETKPKISLSVHQAGSGVESFNNRLVQAYGYTYVRCFTMPPSST